MSRGLDRFAVLALLGIVMSGCNHAGAASAPTSSGPLVAYASGYGPNIDMLVVDPATGALTQKQSLASFGPAPSYLAITRGATNLYALDESAPGRVGAYAIESATGALTFLNDVPSGGNGPAHLSLDRADRFVFVANYTDGSVSVIPVRAGGRLGFPIQTLSVGAQAHMIIADPTNRFVYVPCKGADFVAQFVFDRAIGRLVPNAIPRVMTAAGAGPRHLAFHPNGRFAYLVNELDNTVNTYAVDPTAGTLSPIDTQPTLAAGFTGKDTAAEVWVHPSGAWVLASNRGDDSFVVFAVDPFTGKLAQRGHTKTGGAMPRDFAVDPTGAFVYAANQGSGNIVPFRFDGVHGTMAPAAAPVPVASASFIALVRLPASR